MPFAKNQVLSPAKAMSGGDTRALNALKTGLAELIGKKLKSDYHWDRPVALDFKAYDKLSKSLDGQTGLKYEIKVDGGAKKILFVVRAGSKALEEVAIFSKLGDIAKAAEVVNLQGGDSTMGDFTAGGAAKTGAASKQARKFNGSTSAKATYDDPRPNKKTTSQASGGTKGVEPTDLGGINKHKRIVLVGHGGGDVSGDKTYKASVFGGRNVKQIVDFLIGEGLKPGYSGTIYLSGCHTAAGFDDHESFAAKVRDGFKAKKYTSLKVAGTAGRSYTNADGSKTSVPAALDKDLAKTVEKVRKLVASLEKAQKETDAEVVKTQAQVRTHALEYKSCSDLIADMPPETQGTLRKTLLDPLEKAHDELAGALSEMLKSKKTLDGACKSEKAYLAKIENLLKDRKRWESGQITKADYRKTEKEFRVDDWWGHFGEAKATKISGEKKISKLNALFAKLRSKSKK